VEPVRQHRDPVVATNFSQISSGRAFTARPYFRLNAASHHHHQTSRPRDGNKRTLLIMAKSVNRVTLIGHLGRDPQLKHTGGGTAVANFTLATNDRYKDKDGNWQERTEWHNITCWARLAEIASEYLKKGRAVYVEGSLRTHSWDDKQSGQKRYQTYISATDLVLLGGERSEGSSGSSRESDIDQSFPGEEPEFVSAGAGEEFPF
jgi:single-strand DNA-binding protein